MEILAPHFRDHVFRCNLELQFGNIHDMFMVLLKCCGHSSHNFIWNRQWVKIQNVHVIYGNLLHKGIENKLDLVLLFCRGQVESLVKLVNRGCQAKW